MLKINTYKKHMEQPPQKTTIASGTLNEAPLHIESDLEPRQISEVLAERVSKYSDPNDPPVELQAGIYVIQEITPDN